MTKDKFEDLLVDLCFENWEKLPETLQRTGLPTTLIENNNSIVLYGASMRCGFSIHEDPQGRAIQISMAVAGADAFRVFPNILEKINSRRAAMLKKVVGSR